MKTFIAILITIGASILGSVSAQQPIAKKPPVGVPADATSFNGKWYRVYFEKGRWQHARDRCNVLGGQLAVVPDEATQAFIKKLADSTALWLGATDEKVKNASKRILNTTIGCSIEPNATVFTSDCVANGNASDRMPMATE